MQIIEGIDNDLRGESIPHDLTKTTCLCACILRTISEMIRGAFCCLEGRSIVAYNQLCRSLLEHIIDMRYIALKNEQSINDRFANYNKIKHYLERDDIEFNRDKIPIIEKRYQEYVIAYFPDLIKTHTSKSLSGLLIPDWDAIEKSIRKSYLSGWSKKSFHDKVKEIERLLKHRFNFEDDDDFALIDPILDFAVRWFSFYSLHTHPSVFGSIPHFVPIDSSFKLEWEWPKKLSADKEGFLVSCLSYAHESFGFTFPDETGHKKWRIRFVHYLQSNPTISNWYFNSAHNS